jgi:biotin transport system substrate-specific component
MSPVRLVWVTVLAVAAVALAARFSLALPGTPVPQSLQTLAVVLVGVVLGSRRGAGALVAYAVVGALGAPVFADGAGGVDQLLGPTGGYLAGFIVAAWLAGWWVERGWAASVASALLGIVAGHAVILALGWIRLATLTGAGPAWTSGVQPFLVGGLLKSAVAAAAAVWWSGWLRGRLGGTNLSGSEALDAPE